MGGAKDLQVTAFLSALNILLKFIYTVDVKAHVQCEHMIRLSTDVNGDSIVEHCEEHEVAAQQQNTGIHCCLIHEIDDKLAAGAKPNYCLQLRTFQIGIRRFERQA